jgi:hypothetical protein
MEVRVLRRVEEDPVTTARRILAAGEFSIKNHCTITTSREYKPSLPPTIVKGRSVASGFSQNDL